MVPMLELHSLEQQFSKLRVYKNYLDDGIYLSCMAYPGKSRLEEDVEIQLYI